MLGELFHLRPQLGFMQVEVIHSTNPQNTHSWKRRADTVHKRTTCGAKVIRHGIPRRNGARLAVTGEVLAAA